MLRLLFQPLWTALLLSVLPIFVIRAQPYDDSGLRGLVAPGNCIAPCFMDIQPGVTTMAEAVATLEQHTWANAVLANMPLDIRGYGPVAIMPPSWDWSGAQPGWIDPAADGQSWVINDKIDYLEVRTHFRLGDVRLLLGRPDAEEMRAWEDRQGTVFIYSAWYEEARLEVLIRGLCPVGRLSHRPVTLRLRATPPESALFRQHAECPD